MSEAGHFNKKHAQEDKRPKVRFFEDFPVAMRREADGTPIHVQGGKVIWRAPSTHVKESKHVAKADVPEAESKFYKTTPISTIIEKTNEGERSGARDTVGEKESVARVRKRIDVNKSSMKL